VVTWPRWIFSNISIRLTASVSSCNQFLGTPMNTTGNSTSNVGQYLKLVPISDVATTQEPSVPVFPRQSTQPPLPAPLFKPAIPSNVSVPALPVPTNKLIARIPKQQPNRSSTPIPPASTSTAVPPLADCWKKQPFSEVMHMNPHDGIRYVKRYYECAYSLDDCRAQKIVHCLPQGDSVTYLWTHNHPLFNANSGQSASSIFLLLLFFLFLKLCDLFSLTLDIQGKCFASTVRSQAQPPKIKSANTFNRVSSAIFFFEFARKFCSPGYSRKDKETTP
jgi:hypothetical protein